MVKYAISSYSEHVYFPLIYVLMDKEILIYLPETAFYVKSCVCIQSVFSLCWYLRCLVTCISLWFNLNGTPNSVILWKYVRRPMIWCNIQWFQLPSPLLHIDIVIFKHRYKKRTNYKHNSLHIRRRLTAGKLKYHCLTTVSIP